MVIQAACHALTRTIEQYSPANRHSRYQPNVRRFDQQPLERP
jgi:hypothetical protein